MHYVTYLKNHKAFMLTNLLLTFFIHTTVQALPLPASLNNKPVYHHQVQQVNGWSCGYNTLYNACSLENSNGKHNAYSDVNRFKNTCLPRLQQQGIAPNHGASNTTIEGLAPHLGLNRWLSLRTEDYGVSPLISKSLSVPVGNHHDAAHVKLLINQAHQRRGEETISHLQQELDRAPLGQSHFAHFMCSVHSARGVPHAVLASVVKRADGHRELHVCDNMNEPIHEHTPIKKHIDYLCQHFGIGGAATPHKPHFQPVHTPQVAPTSNPRPSIRQQPSRRIAPNQRQQPQQRARRVALNSRQQPQRRQAPSVRNAAVRLRLARAQQTRTRRAQLQKKALALRTLNKRSSQRTTRTTNRKRR